MDPEDSDTSPNKNIVNHYEHNSSSSQDQHLLMLFPKVAGQILPTELRLTQLPHPRQDSTVVSADNTSQGFDFLEIQAVQMSKYASWFINQRVSSSKSLYTATPLDPRLLLLPYLERTEGKYSPLEQIIHSYESSKPSQDLSTSRIPLKNVQNWKMEELCDVNDKLGDDMILYRYNAEKTKLFLMKKVEKVSKVLAKQRIRRRGKSLPAFADSFVLGNAKEASLSDDSEAEPTVIHEDIKTAIEIVIDSLSDSSAKLLLESYNMTMADITSKTAAVKRKADWEVALEQEQEAAASTGILMQSKPTSGASSTKPVSNTNSTAKASSAASKTAKSNAIAAKGSKSISSFFAAK